MFDLLAKYKIHWELTDICNLKCPMCPRTDIDNYCQPVKGIKKTQYFLKDVKQYLPGRFLRKLIRIDFCGNFGDPCVARDFYEICEYLIKEHGIIITVATNGSMRNPSWWKKLGELFSDTECRIDFHIDGLKDTNHLYRIGANWHKIMGNTDAVISGGARANWIYILFKHNQHQIDEAQKIARKMGFNSFVRVDTGRFPEGGKFRYMHPDGHLCYLEEATISNHRRIYNAKTKLLKDDVTPRRQINRKALESHVAAEETLLESPNPRFLTAVNGIMCKASKSNRFYLDARGYVSPCCWVSNNVVKQRAGSMIKAITTAEKDLENYNVRNKPLGEILQDEVFKKVFKELWESNSLSTCCKKCGKKHRNILSKTKFDV